MFAEINCRWGEWGLWSRCSADCKGGMTKRTRTVANERKEGGLECKGLGQEVKKCNEHPCGRRLSHNFVKLYFADFADQSFDKIRRT